jgi:arylsulfatase A-like enzyme
MTTRRSFLGAAAGAGVAFPSLQVPRRRPNFIVIYTDDHGFGDLGCQGARDMKTPNFDALAEGGARFTNWHAAAPMCAPSRAALMTGRYPIRCGVPTNGPSLPSSERTLASILRSQGYSTALFGKWHLGSDGQTAPNAHGFDQFFGFHSGCIDFFSHRYYWGEPRRVNYHDLWRNRTEVFEDGKYMTEMITAEARNFLLNARDKPFFLYLAYNAPHYPMHAPRKYVERFPNLERERQMYAAMVAGVDDGVGEVVETLEKTGQRENTFIFYAADNGATREPRAGLDDQPAKGGLNGPLRGFKFSLFDGGTHVPAIMNWPARIPARQVIREVGCTLDVLPTFCGAAGAPLPAGRTIDGRDVLPMAAGKAKSPHDALFWSSGGQNGVRRANWKLVIDGFTADGTEDGRKKLTGEDAMFLSDLDQDPGETRNLRRLHPNLVDELATMQRRWLEEVKTK